MGSQFILNDNNLESACIQNGSLCMRLHTCTIPWEMDNVKANTVDDYPIAMTACVSWRARYKGSIGSEAH